MKISEKFLSIQGEANPIGQYVFFIRTSMCNLSCSFCDTKAKIQINNDYQLEEAIEDIKKFGTDVVFTGGEPTLWAISISPIIRLFPNTKFYIETNGTLDASKLFYPNVSFNISPKPPLYKIQRSFLDPKINKVFKFVIDPYNIENVPWDLMRKLKNVYLMPLTDGDDRLLERHQIVANLAIERGYNFSPRLQLLSKFL
ncbi:MAG: 7-carboxy-7-deazaguanine synthase QueE [Sulfolobaceae archaeon]